jgi:hypothetical protein
MEDYCDEVRGGRFLKVKEVTRQESLEGKPHADVGTQPGSDETMTPNKKEKHDAKG